MSASSKIEWTDSTWNPVRARRFMPPGHYESTKIGWHCEHVSEGCRNCYAESMNRWRGTKLDYKPGHRTDIEIFLDEKTLLAPLHWRKPRMIFPCSMTDMFADFVPDEWLDLMFAVMALTPQHKYQVLTKRTKRMREYMTTPNRKRSIAEQVMPISCSLALAAGKFEARIKLDHFSQCFEGNGPFHNIWFGTSCEDQANADARIPDLLATPAAVRFVSLEPLLGPIDLQAIAKHGHGGSAIYSHSQPRLDWVIVGGESGPNARPMHPDWARSIRDQCAAADVPFFFKQWGAWAKTGLDNHFAYHFADGMYMHKIGERIAGRLLDGREWNGMPA